MIPSDFRKGGHVLMIGSFDTKGEDFTYLYQCLIEEGIPVLTMNIGVMGTTDLFPVDIEADEVAEEGGESILRLRDQKDRGRAIEIMGKGGSRIVERLYREEVIGGVVGMGGGGGTFMILRAMSILPIGFPKLCVSTLAAKDLSDLIGSKDIILLPSVVDIAGLNFISRKIIQQAAKIMGSLYSIEYNPDKDHLGNIAISVFGNTTACADHCISLLKSEDFETIAFHAVGTGGEAMEDLITDGNFQGVIDLTITELADELCGGICSAGPDRLTAGSKKGIPQVIVPGCLDMVNFGAIETVPEKYKDRLLYQWAPDVTLMRTNQDENRELGRIIGEKVNSSLGPVIILLPLGGLSEIGGIGKIFYNPEIDRELFDSIREHADKKVKILEVNANINTKEFAEKVVEVFLEMIIK